MIMDEILEILTEIHPDVDFEVEDSLIDDGILDSFDIVYIIAQIKDRFDIKVGAQHIVPENFNSAEAIWELVKKLEDED